MTLNIWELSGIAVIVLAFAFLLANIIANKKTSVIGWLVSLLVLFMYFDKFRLDILYTQYLSTINMIDEYFLLASVVALLFTFVHFVCQTHKKRTINQLYRFAVNQDNSQILAFISKKHKLLHTTSKLSELLDPAAHNSPFKLFAAQIDDKKIELKQLPKALGLRDSKIATPIKMKFTFSNSLSVDYEVTKKLVEHNNRSLGYILVDTVVSQSYKMEVAKEFKKNLFVYLDMFQTPLAYFDQDQKLYVASHAMLDMIPFTDNQVTQAELLEKMHPNDIETYRMRKIEDSKRNKIYFRLKVDEEFVWFEESSVRYFDKDFILIKRVEAIATSKVVFGNYKAMIKMVSELSDNKKDFGLIVMNLSNITQIAASQGKELSELLLGKFFIKILNGPLKGQIKLYKLGSTEYAVLIENGEYTQLVIRNLHNNTSELASQNISINNMKYRLECALGVVASQDFATADPRAIIKAGFDTLKEASDPDYLKDYSIYQPKQTVTVEYDLKTLGIDLDDDLKEFENELDDEETTKKKV